ncbi:type VI secretion system Vgr family protein [Aquimarina muelleri]|uniref:Type IV secretion protein Rhs n=1 Tax=Aquimarina muelleri TaxID=279356 RepID=A0A918JY17_9FLAO|nr:phage baseplate assembly protein V [Aquimarina muelleri]MCX2764511.1 phage baseplate assembly protein V [Aquimarina muelleri]GGX30852.1 type IV secretion protein Rhs [Aquimarina muelleri]
MIEPKTKVSIDGEFLVNFENVSLNQQINEHHDFEITLDYDTIESIGTHTLDKSKDWLGKPVVINFDEKEFLGVITNVQLMHDNGFNSKLIVSGYSNTIKLEGGLHMQSWLEKDLSTIVNDTVDAGGVQAAVSPVFTTPIEYQAQYQESHFQFIQRLAKQYNEWLYYDGVKLVFGKPDLEAAIPIEYGKDINTVSISIQAKANNYTNFSYNALDDKKNESKTKGNVAGLNELGAFALDSSKQLFTIEPNGFSVARVKDKSEIDNVLKNKQSSAVADANVLSATSHLQGLTVGSVIKVTSARYDKGEFDIKNYGEYIITQISHNATGSYEYTNQFRAISSGVEVLPEPGVEFPIAQPQIATVLSNEDPKKKGRVQVQFQWQTGAMKTSWIRVMTPDAGKSDDVGTNRGFVHIPEVDDQVMIGFRYNDPNRPFVMGSLFSGTTGIGGLDGNKIKSITTRTGSTITFDDAEGKGKITISDPSGNIVTLNGDETITISAPKSITMNSKEINILGEDKVHIESKEVTIVGTESIKETSDTLVEIQSPKISTSSDTTEIKATKTMDIVGDGPTNVKGLIVNLN